MNIVFRADANRNVGMGHVMRCLSIADSCTAVGCHVKFVTAGHEVETLIKGRGYEVGVLGSDYTDMEGELSSWPQGEHPDAIFVDSYHATSSYLSNLKQIFKSRVVYMDDLHSFPYPVDFLVNYNVYGQEIDYEGIYSHAGIECPELLLGPSYAPLRQAFKGLERKIQKPFAGNVLFSTGGADEFHLALHFANAIVNQERDKHTYHILLGALNQDKETIRILADNHGRIVLHENVSDMKALIQGMDIAVSAAGSTLYEICACGVPLITYVLADNQRPGAEAFGQKGLAVDMGDIREKNGQFHVAAIDKILNAVDALSADYGSRVEMGARMQRMIDGHGADRIVDAVVNNETR